MEPHVAQADHATPTATVSQTIEPEAVEDVHVARDRAARSPSMMVQVVERGTGTARADRRRHRRRQDRHRADRRRRASAARVVHRLRAGRGAAVRGVGDRRGRRQLRQRGDRWRRSPRRSPGRCSTHAAGRSHDAVDARTSRRRLPRPWPPSARVFANRYELGDRDRPRRHGRRVPRARPAARPSRRGEGALARRSRPTRRSSSGSAARRRPPRASTTRTSSRSTTGARRTTPPSS